MRGSLVSGRRALYQGHTALGWELSIYDSKRVEGDYCRRFNPTECIRPDSWSDRARKGFGLSILYSSPTHVSVYCSTTVQRLFNDLDSITRAYDLEACAAGSKTAGNSPSCLARLPNLIVRMRSDVRRPQGPAKASLSCKPWPRSHRLSWPAPPGCIQPGFPQGFPCFLERWIPDAGSRSPIAEYRRR